MIVKCLRETTKDIGIRVLSQFVLSWKNKFESIKMTLIINNYNLEVQVKENS